MLGMNKDNMMVESEALQEKDFHVENKLILVIMCLLLMLIIRMVVVC